MVYPCPFRLAKALIRRARECTCVASAEDLQDASGLPVLPLARTTSRAELARFVVRKVQAAWLAYFFNMALGLPGNSQVVPSEAFEYGKEHARSHLSSGHVADIPQ
jgi:hypothetical protein